MLLSSSISVLISCLVVLSVVERGILKSLTKIVDLFISPFSSISLLYIFFSSLVWCIYMWDCYIFLVDWPFIIIQCLSLDFVCVFNFEKFNYDASWCRFQRSWLSVRSAS